MVLTCEFIGTYLLNILSNKYSKNNINLYRDDGLAVLEQKSGPELEMNKKRYSKYIQRLWFMYNHSMQFKSHKLLILYL